MCMYTGVSARKMPVLLMRGQPQGRLLRPPSLHQIFSFSSQCRLLLPDSALPVLRAPGTPASTVHIFAPRRFSWTMEPFLMSQAKASSLSDLRTCFSGSQKKKKLWKISHPFSENCTHWGHFTEKLWLWPTRKKNLASARIFSLELSSPSCGFQSSPTHKLPDTPIHRQVPCGCGSGQVEALRTCRLFSNIPYISIFWTYTRRKRKIVYISHPPKSAYGGLIPNPDTSGFL